MFISDRALEHMEKTAQSVGFGVRTDYPFRGPSAISAADWKGNSIACCVFAENKNAEEYLRKSLTELDDLGGGLTGQVLPVPWENGGMELFVAVITAKDLISKAENQD